jgi:radical SAM protein with 4Fe4S-binding SPASM domain
MIDPERIQLRSHSNLRMRYLSPLRALFDRVIRAAIQIRRFPACAIGNESIVFEPFEPRPNDRLVELVVRVLASREDLERYLYSKLYYSFLPDSPFSEDRVVCFEVPRVNCAERLQIALPAAVWQAARESNHLRLRLDVLPYSKGAWQVDALRLVSELDVPELARAANRVMHRQWVREQVRVSETQHRVQLPHYPESLSIELTPVCNLRCPHCSSHGMAHLHKHHNQLPEMPVPLLRRLAEEAFPHVSVVSIVGRGEPTLASDALWDCLVSQLREHDVRVSCVTNGTRIRQRFDASIMPWVHELTFSVDGATARTFEANRYGAKYDSVMDAMRYYNDLRNSAGLVRRPQLTISWTLKRNNVEELLDFVHQVAPLQPDLLSIRHMVIFQDKERSQSLLYHSREANAALREAYAELDRLGLRHESPPLMLEASPVFHHSTATCSPLSHVTSEEQTTAAHDAQAAPREGECNWMHRTAIIMSDGEVTTCGKHYGMQVGHLDERTCLQDLWNGTKMHSLRRCWGTANMWEQCKACWLREIRWHSQRQAKDLAKAFDLRDPMDFSNAAWDYRSYSEL